MTGMKRPSPTEASPSGKRTSPGWTSHWDPHTQRKVHKIRWAQMLTITLPFYYIFGHPHNKTLTIILAFYLLGSSTPNTLSVIDLDPMGGGSESGDESGSSHLHFLLIMISLAFGMENVWRLPTMTLYHGGGKRISKVLLLVLFRLFVQSEWT